MLTLGRISGISGIISGLLSLNLTKNDVWRGTFLVGLLSGPFVYMALGVTLPQVVIDNSFTYLIIAGVLVGFGATLGSGCNRGHGVCGVSRLSPRSIIATLIFLVSAIIIVFLSR